ncbi:tRNA (guanosine(46)-N7)-methyltransferase TrmB [Pseudonocardia endophytica]|uniref:tRNA (guanine-N(7)-)-methyltransferase n=1 Tax=Pseudonocardia endophytica TaxID=401976 RepID=A0A4R1HZ71_PSEEN|nr:tRNA (guanosine(46)-N7)-methyltransferase TrmB [Pseudonocardia endophytica]TCK27718.1 tRNA (guanine-N(7)-)-methyltransferase [Pseudonocardia endophytica]
MPEPAAHPGPTRIPSFVHHRTRLTEGQQHAWERWWPEYGAEVSDVLPGPGEPPWDPRAWFGRTAPLRLEIGSGMGETTAALAAAEPDDDHLAVEVYEPGLAQLLMRITDAGLTNQRLLRGDAVTLLSEAIAPQSLDEIRIFFPDPWPKRRHRKRRLVQPDFVRIAVSRIRDGGRLHLATDWPDYAQQMLAVCTADPALRPFGATDTDGYAERPVWRPLTKFERRAVTDHRPVRDLLYTAVHAPGTGDIRSVTGSPEPTPVPPAPTTSPSDREGRQ